MPFGERHPPRTSRRFWQAPIGDWAYRASRALVGSAFAPFIQRHLYHQENLAAVVRSGGSFILAPNHISHFDGPILTATAPGVIDWLVDKPFFLPNGLGAWMRHSGGIAVPWPPPVVGAVRESLRRLKRGRVLGIFPDGGLRAGAESVLGGAPVSRGASWLSVRADVPVVPCVMVGTDRLYLKENWRFWRGRVPVWIGFGPAIQPHEWVGRTSAVYYVRMRALFDEMAKEFHWQPDDLPTTAQERWARARQT